MKYTLLAYNDYERTSLAYSIIFDATVSVGESYTNEITKFTVEDGGQINDHAVKSKDKINLEGVVTDLSFNQGEDGLVMFNADGAIQAVRTESWSKKTKASLLDINEKLLPCSFKVSERVDGQEVIESDTFPCLFESLNLDAKNGETGFIQPKIVLVPVRIAKLKFEGLSADQQAIPELKNQNNQANRAKTTSGSDGSGDDKAKTDGKEVDLDLPTPDVKEAGDDKENKSRLQGILDAGKNMAKLGVEASRDENMKKALEAREEERILLQGK